MAYPNPWFLRGAMLAAIALSACSQQPTEATQKTSSAALAPAATPAEPEVASAMPPEPFGDGARSFAAVKDMLLKRYFAEGATEDDLYRAATQGMLEGIDPKRRKWNKLLGPSEVLAIHSDLKGEIIGVGAKIHFESETGYTDVEGVVPGSPAERAGIVAGDRILTVNGKFYKGLSATDVLNAIRGKAGDVVTLTLLRADKVLTFAIKRELVTYDPVSSMALPSGQAATGSAAPPTVGYARVRSFTAKTAPSLRAVLEGFAAKGASALVVDLRDNQGGGFDDAVACVELLVPAGAPIVRLKKRDEAEETIASKGAPILPDVPLVVLVDHGTSSGAELMAGVLREQRKATVVGSRTFGKWSVQHLEELPNGYAIKFTASLFKTPAGESYDGVGLEPDVEVDVDAKQSDKLHAITDPDRRIAADAPLRSALGLLRRPR